MRTALSATLVALATTIGLSAQAPTVSYTVTIWAWTVAPGGGMITNPTPVAPPVVYPAASVPCGQPKLPQSPAPLVNPTEGRFDDPANPALDCVTNITKQVADLPPGTYKAAWMANAGGTSGSSPLGALTDPFERRLGPPPTPLHPRLR